MKKANFSSTDLMRFFKRDLASFDDPKATMRTLDRTAVGINRARHPVIAQPSAELAEVSTLDGAIAAFPSDGADYLVTRETIHPRAIVDGLIDPFTAGPIFTGVKYNPCPSRSRSEPVKQSLQTA
jgi:hypothetical protein